MATSPERKDRLLIWDSWSQAGMRSASVVMRNPFAKNPLQVAFVDWNHKVQAFPSDRPDQSLAKCVRLRCSDWSLQHRQPKASNDSVQFCGKRRMPIVNEEAVLVIAWNRLAQLLNRPFGSRVQRDIAMQNAARTDLHHHKNLHDAEAGADCGREVARHQRSGVVPNKGAPGLGAPI